MSRVSGRGIAAALALACASLVTQAGAVSKTVDMKLIVLVNGAPPCTITGATVSFGTVLTTGVGSEDYVQPIKYSLSCNGRASDYLKLQVQGTSMTLNGESVLKTNVSGLGIRIQQASDQTMVPIGSSSWLNFTYASTSGVALEAALVKASGTELKAQDFSAAATLVVDYQ